MKKYGMTRRAGLILGSAFALSVATAAWSQAPLTGQFLTGSVGGVYDVLGGGLVNTINRNAENVRLNPSNPPSVTVTPVQVNEGRAPFGILHVDVIDRAVRGVGEYEKPQENLRVAMGLYDNVMSQVVLDDAEITNIKDAAGLRVGVPSESTKRTVAAVYEMAGVPEDQIEWVFLTYAETASALRDGYIDIGTFTGFPKNGTVEGLASTEGIRFLEIDESVEKEWNKQNPMNAIRTVPGGTYPGVEEDAKFYAVFVTLLTNSNVSDDDVYKVVKAILENPESVSAAHPAGQQVTPEKTQAYVRDGVISPDLMHPGARKYFEEIGVDLQPGS